MIKKIQAERKAFWKLHRKGDGAVTIKEVSEQYQVSQDTLRYYERVGIIPQVTRTAGGIRDYQEQDISWV